MQDLKCLKKIVSSKNQQDPLNIVQINVPEP